MFLPQGISKLFVELRGFASKSYPTVEELVFVDCQFGLEEGKMKGSTKPRRMDEPFYS